MAVGGPGGARAATIWQVDAAGATVLAALHKQCRTAAYAETWSADAIATILRLPGAVALVAGTQTGAPTGLAMVRIAAAEAELLTLGVIPEARRGGVAGALLRAAGAAAAAAGAGRMVLEAATNNVPALALYRRWGYAEIGRRRKYYRRVGGPRVDAVVMAKKLARLQRK